MGSFESDSVVNEQSGKKPELNDRYEEKWCAYGLHQPSDRGIKNEYSREQHQSFVGDGIPAVEQSQHKRDRKIDQVRQWKHHGCIATI